MILIAVYFFCKYFQCASSIPVMHCHVPQCFYRILRKTWLYVLSTCMKDNYYVHIHDIFGNITQIFALVSDNSYIEISLWKIYQKVVIINKFWKQFWIKVKCGSENWKSAELDSVQYSHTKITKHYEENLNIIQYIIQLLYQ